MAGGQLTVGRDHRGAGVGAAQVEREDGTPQAWSVE